jgi:hypothetical protein
MAFTVVATVALAQTPAPPANDPIKRTPLQKTEYPEGHFTYVMMVEIAPNATVTLIRASRAATSSTAISIS